MVRVVLEVNVLDDILGGGLSLQSMRFSLYVLFNISDCTLQDKCLDRSIISGVLYILLYTAIGSVQVSDSRRWKCCSTYSMYDMEFPAI